jgi:hypothetical protein
MSSDVPDTDAPRRHRSIWITVGAVVLVVVVIVVVVILTRGGDNPGVSPGAESSSGTAAVSPGAAPTSPVPSPSIPKPTASGTPTVVPTGGTESTTAPLTEKAALGNGVSVQVSKIESVQGEAQGPGEIAGPAVRVSIEVTNGTKKEVPMNLALVNVYYGKNKAPASPLSGPGVAPLSGTIPAGGSASGTYVFGVPVNQRDPLTVEFSYTTDAPTVIFSGKP